MAISRPAPLYNNKIHFFENYARGPRMLTNAERASINKLKKEIARLDPTGLLLVKNIFPNFKASMPFGIASGAAYGGRFLGMYKELGYGFLTQKTVRDREWEANPMPHSFYLSKGSFGKGFVTSSKPTEMMANSFGMHCLGPKVWEPELAAFKGENHSVPLIISGVITQARSHDEIIGQYVEIGKKAEKIGADAYEINISCPNEMAGNSKDIQDDAAFTGEILEELTRKLGIPILVKIGHRENLETFALVVAPLLSGRGGIVAINSKPAAVRNRNGSYAFGSSRPKAGISYKPLKPYAKDALKQLLKVRKETGYNFKIFSVGGVVTPGDVLERLRMGADAVESAAAAVSRPTFALEVKKRLLQSISKE